VAGRAYVFLWALLYGVAIERTTPVYDESGAVVARVCVRVAPADPADGDDAAYAKVALDDGKLLAEAAAVAAAQGREVRALARVCACVFWLMRCDAGAGGAGDGGGLGRAGDGAADRDRAPPDRRDCAPGR
jgi:hypothetical protein